MGSDLSLYAKRLDRGRFVWPQTVDGAVALTAGQMGYLLGSDRPEKSPTKAGVLGRLDSEKPCKSLVVI